MALKIHCKLSLEYLGTLVSTGNFGVRGSSGYLEISDSGGGEESGRVTEGTTEGVMEGAIERATEGATKGATEGCFWRGRPRPWTEIILELELIFF